MISSVTKRALLYVFSVFFFWTIINGIVLTHRLQWLAGTKCSELIFPMRLGMTFKCPLSLSSISPHRYSWCDVTFSLAGHYFEMVQHWNAIWCQHDTIFFRINDFNRLRFWCGGYGCGCGCELSLLLFLLRTISLMVRENVQLLTHLRVSFELCFRNACGT